mgnify:CR=1 FL=1|jgi:hypothetical protein
MNTKRKVTSHMCGIVFMDPRYKNVYNVNTLNKGDMYLLEEHMRRDINPRL